MKSVRDTLYIITSYSIRSGFLKKADALSDLAVSMFPTDKGLNELRALVLLHLERFEEAEALANGYEAVSPNMSFIKIRTSLLLGMDEAERATRVRNYLDQVQNLGA